MAQEQEYKELAELPPVTSGARAQMGLFVLKLVKMMDAGPSQFTDDGGATRQRVCLRWEVQHVIDCDIKDELVGQVWSQYCNYTMARRSTLLAIAEAIQQREIPDNTRVSPSDLVSGVVKMSIAEQAGRNGKRETVWTPMRYTEAEPLRAKPGEPSTRGGGVQEATPRQLKYLQAVAREVKLTDAQLAKRIDEIFGKPIEQLSRRQVSDFIEQLQSERNTGLADDDDDELDF